MSPGPSSTSIASGILIHPAVWPFGHKGHGLKIGSCAPFLGGAGFPSNNVACAEAYQSTTMPSFMLIHPTFWPQYTNVTDKTDRQTGQTQQSVALAEVYLRTKWHLNLSSRLATTDMGQFFFGGGELRPYLTQCACFILIHATAWQQYTNVTDRQTDRQDRQDRTTVR